MTLGWMRYYQPRGPKAGCDSSPRDQLLPFTFTFTSDCRHTCAHVQYVNMQAKWYVGVATGECPGGGVSWTGKWLWIMWLTAGAMTHQNASWKSRLSARKLCLPGLDPSRLLARPQCAGPVSQRINGAGAVAMKRRRRRRRRRGGCLFVRQRRNDTATTDNVHADMAMAARALHLAQAEAEAQAQA